MKIVYVLACCFVVLAAGTALAAGSGEELYKSTCAGCHGVDGGKTPGNTVALKDQTSDEIFTKLKGYAAQTYGGEKKQVMQNIVEKHPEAQLREAADYAGTL